MSQFLNRKQRARLQALGAKDTVPASRSESPSSDGVSARGPRSNSDDSDDEAGAYFGSRNASRGSAEKTSKTVMEQQKLIRQLTEAYQLKVQQFESSEQEVRSLRRDRKAAQKISDNLRRSYEIALYVLANQGVKACMFMSSLVSTFEHVTKYDPAPLPNNIRAHVVQSNQLLKFVVNITKQMAQSFSRDAVASFFQSTNLTERIPFVKPNIRPNIVKTMTLTCLPEGLLRNFQRPWTDYYNKEAYQFLGANEFQDVRVPILTCSTY